MNGSSEPIVNDDLGYPIVIADDARPELLRWLQGRGQPFVAVCDAQHDVTAIAQELGKHPLCRAVLPFTLGEPRKRLSTVERVYEALIQAGADRETLLVGLGGGVGGDLFGFVASTYMRGIPYAHVATTLVSMVDASIGGKTGVDLPSGKNLAGTFSDPVAVFAHIDALQTLPYRSLRDGLAEMLKAAVIEGDTLFESLETLAPHAFWRWPWLEIVAASIKVKTMIVLDDRTERGMRELLNLGHTFGHGLERASNYRISHGAGVALGLRAAGLLALRSGRYSENEHLRVLGTMALLGMPLYTRMPSDAVFEAMLSDKKRRDRKLRFVLPRAIGDVEYGVTVPERLVKATLEDLRRPPQDVG